MAGTDFWGKPGSRSVLPTAFAIAFAAVLIMAAAFAGLLTSRHPAQQSIAVLTILAAAATVYFVTRRYLDREFAAVRIYGADAPAIDEVRKLLLLEIGADAPAASEIYLRTMDDASARIEAPSPLALTLKERAIAEVRGVIRAAMMERHPRYISAALFLAAYDMYRTSPTSDEIQFREIITRRLGL